MRCTRGSAGWGDDSLHSLEPSFGVTISTPNFKMKMNRLMSSAQYARLTLVLLLPLLGFGWWLAERGTPLSINYEVACNEIARKPACRFRFTETTQEDDTSAVLKFNLARIFNDFAGSVYLFSVDEKADAIIKSTDQQTVSISLPLAYTPRLIPRNPFPRYGTKCNLISISGQRIRPLDPSDAPMPDNTYMYMCDIAFEEENPQLSVPQSGIFRPASDELTASLNATTSEIKATYTAASLRSKARYVADLLIPLLGYFAISIAIFILISIARFVIGEGGQTNATGDRTGAP